MFSSVITICAQKDYKTSTIDSEIKSLYDQYKERFIISCFTDNNLQKCLVDSTVECEYIYFYIANKDSSELTNYLNKISNYFKGLNEDKRRLTIRYLSHWLKIDEILSIPFTFNDIYVPEFAEIIYEIEETRHLVEKHFIVKEQYWSSLSSSQLGCLSIDVPTYIVKLSPASQLKVLSEYYRISEKLIHELND